ncbi:MAG: hypothetical protein EBW71_02700, partial [Betaproteobacteria bacterium]|nr:hypothetical protein [Betaproteobacteria bacterium]
TMSFWNAAAHQVHFEFIRPGLLRVHGDAGPAALACPGLAHAAAVQCRLIHAVSDPIAVHAATSCALVSCASSTAAWQNACDRAMAMSVSEAVGLQPPDPYCRLTSGLRYGL